MYFQKVLFIVVTVGIAYPGVDGQGVVCPAVRTTSGWLDLFPLPCRKSSECRTVMGPSHVCCKGFCTKGVSKPAEIRTVTNVQSSTSTSTTSTTTTTTPSTTTTSTTTTTTTPPSTTSSTTPKPKPTTTEALRPYFTLLPILSSPVTTAKPKTSTKKATAAKTQSQKLVCPKPGQAPFVLFPVPCENSAQCRVSSGPDHVCCEARCTRGVPAPRSAPVVRQVPHQPLLGVIPRECPSQPLGELLFEVQPCKADADCWPRVCCPDGQRSYCRTAKARLDLVPVVGNQIDAPVRMLEQYLQCTAPPQYDLFPKQCSSSVDCFPNLCCAEGGKKHCRPPQRSLLALLAGVGQRVGTGLVNLRQAQANRDNNKV